MLISLNWLKDFVDIPASIEPKDLALQFTITTAEVEGVERHDANVHGLVAARIESLRAQPGESRLKTVIVDAGSRKFTSLTTAPDVAIGDLVIYAPPGARVDDQTLGEKDASGRDSQGMVVAWGALGFPHIGAHAVKLPPGMKPGDAIDAGAFSDWIIEVDNKSITHRPDCWGHYGIGREFAAMLRLPLRPYEVTPTEALTSGLPAIPIEIDNPAMCPRYTGLTFSGLRAQPSPLWMQTRLAHCGMRPIDLIVDLTNYVMLELGQPMHAFDGSKVTNIQVAAAKPGEKFKTLDGVDRTLTADTLMIQCGRKNIAIAGIMGGAETEVGPATTTVLLESACFDAPTIRRASTALGHRTEAGARFEKSLDPVNTILGIARFHRLAARELPGLALAGTLSDCYPNPRPPSPIIMDCEFASRFIGPVAEGRPITPELNIDILTRLEFTCVRSGHRITVTPPSYRATKDIEIEADLLEEVARFVGYNNVKPSLPRVTARHFEASNNLTIEERTLNGLCTGGDFVEVHDYIWFDDHWLKTIGFDPGPCLTLKNPATDHGARLRTTLVPGLIAMAERNRHHFDAFQLIEIGTVFQSGPKDVESAQQRRMGLVVAQQGKKAEGTVWDRLRIALDGWARQTVEQNVEFRSAPSHTTWEDADRTADVFLSGVAVGRATLLPASLLLRIDERLRSWSFAVAEVNLAPASEQLRHFEKLPAVPRFPQTDLDFSILINADRRYEAIARSLADYRHDLLRGLSFVGAYEGGSIPEGKRSLLLRARIGRSDATLADEDIRAFNNSFREFLDAQGLELRA